MGNGKGHKMGGMDDDSSSIAKTVVSGSLAYETPTAMELSLAPLSPARCC